MVRSRSLTLLRPIPSSSACSSRSSVMPSPSSWTSMMVLPSQMLVLMVMRPPPTLRARPCLIEFSTSGCSSMLGTITSSVAGAISFTTLSCGPKRTTSMSRYSSIEVVRFGPQLKVVKEIAPATLDVIVPSMLLQPLVENSIKHGLARKVGGGRITIRTSICDGNTIIEVHDDGLGMTEERLEHALGDGIGLSNVNERLRTIYGPPYHLKLTSVPGQGTCVSVEIPEIALPERVTA